MLKCEIQVFIPGKSEGITITAIWDTGASKTCITQKVVDALGLQPSGMGNIHTAAGEMQTSSYMVTVGLPPKLLIKGVDAMCVTLTHPDLDALIGMDIITLGDFSITNKNGKTCMTFRVPSLHEIDYVPNPNFAIKPAVPDTQVKTVSLGRNAPCHCGSGKKYKNCHGR